jgi:hypothetical protein
MNFTTTLNFMEYGKKEIKEFRDSNINGGRAKIKLMILIAL